MKVRSYSELITIDDFKNRFEYLRLNGSVGIDTFGFDRYLNQRFYHSTEWNTIRDKVIVRDCGCDLGIDGREIFGRIYIHHMNPVLVENLLNGMDADLLNPEYLICTTHNTHNAIHYGDEHLLMEEFIERKPNDTCLWREGDPNAKHIIVDQEIDWYRGRRRKF